jgi:hypothetical protein
MSLAARAQPAPTVLQTLIWPDRAVSTERDLYMRLFGPAGYCDEGREIRFGPGATAVFDTYFNLFNIGKWRRLCGLEQLSLSLTGRGRVEVIAFLAPPHRSWERLASRVVDLAAEGGPGIELPLDDIDPSVPGVIHFELRALGTARLTGAAFTTTDQPRRKPQLAVAITTYKRELEVQRTARRFSRFMQGSAHADRIRMIVVDNGKSADLDAGEGIAAFENENLGGAGGFARGLIEARASGATHCLFMDDDAAIHMESLERTYQMLAYARDPATAVAGAMINATHRWAVWENGATFHTRCEPRFMGLDLRDARAVMEMEHATTADPPRKLYGGWWFFAFPLQHVRHLPFPFFVRGDDVSFSLAHDFRIVTMPGVASFQEGFDDKESPLTWYLDLRSHLAHHLSLPDLEIGRLGLLRIAWWFFLRNLPRCHYETMHALTLALGDVLEGPGFFADNADLAWRRATIGAATRDEAWKPAPQQPRRQRLRLDPEKRRTRLLMKATLAGHLLPGFRLFGNRRTLGPGERGAIRACWGAAEITCRDASGTQAYTVVHSKRRAFIETARMALLSLRLILKYPRLRGEWRRGYGELTSEAFWESKLRLAA